MSLLKVTNRKFVLQAMKEFDQLGRDKFLKKYGFGKARKYFLSFKGKKYDSKAIYGVAYGNEYGRPALWDEFWGGIKETCPNLGRLGFVVIP